MEIEFFILKNIIFKSHRHIFIKANPDNYNLESIQYGTYQRAIEKDMD